MPVEKYDPSYKKVGGYGGLPPSPDFKLAGNGYSPELNDRIRALGGRIAHHLIHLLESDRSTAEKQFAVSFAQSDAGIMKKLINPKTRDSHRIRNVLAGAGHDACMWWTLSPYIFEQLRPSLGNAEAIKKLLLWARTGEPYALEVTLEGLDKYNTHECTVFTLDEDPNHHTHELARQEATRLISEVFAK